MRTAPRVGPGTQIIRIWNHFRFFQPPEIADAIERLGFRPGQAMTKSARWASELPR